MRRLSYQKIKAFIFKKEFLRYLVVGFSNTALTYLLFAILLEFFNLHYLVSVAISTAVGVIFTYIFNFIWAFQPEDCLRFQERFLKYCAVYLFSLLFNMIGLEFSLSVTSLKPLVIQLLLAPFIVIINYCGIKFWALKPKPASLLSAAQD